MQWLSNNWIWIAFVFAFVAMHWFGHGGHGHGSGHSGRSDGRDPRGAGSKDTAETAGVESIGGADRPSVSAHHYTSDVSGSANSTPEQPSGETATGGRSPPRLPQRATRIITGDDLERL